MNEKQKQLTVQWYPGHMTKAKRALQEQLKMIDMVIEVVDARAPKSTRNPDFDRLFAGKVRMLILNKADLADPAATKRWVAHFAAQGIYAVAYSAIGGNARALQKQIEQAAAEIYEKYKKKGVNKTVRTCVCGIPNVGKSAILNRLIGEKRLKEGNKPGVTRGLTWVRLSPYLECMDSPGLLWPKIHNERTGAVIALIGSVRQEILDEEELAYYLIRLLSEVRPDLLRDRYGIEEIPEDAYEALQEICRKRGFLMRGGVADVERGCKTLLEEFRNGKLGTITFELPGEV